MQVRQSIHSDHASWTQEGCREFLVEEIFTPDHVSMTYSHIDRIVFGGIMPVSGELSLPSDIGKEFGVSYFLERREFGLEDGTQLVSRAALRDTMKDPDELLRRGRDVPGRLRLPQIPPGLVPRAVRGQKPARKRSTDQ